MASSAGLIALIQAQNYPGGNTDQQVLTALTANTVPVYNTTLQNFQSFVANFGWTAITPVLNAILAAIAANTGNLGAPMAGFWATLNAGGVNFADPNIQTLFSNMEAAGIITTQTMQGMQAQGITYTNLIAKAGLPTPVLADITAARAAPAVITWYQALDNSILSNVLAGNYSEAQAKAAWAAG